MGFLRRFCKRNEGLNYIKIYHKVYNDFHTIGFVDKINDDLNIAKITFNDINGKTKSYWFHLFTGSVVTLPKNKGEYATDVPETSKKAYMLSVEPVYLYDIDPTADINYKNEDEENKTEDEENKTEDVDNESNPNTSVTKIE